MAIYYISDLHLRHRALARRRGFPSVQAHDQTLMDSLRRRIAPNDTVFLLGDLFAYSYDPVLLGQLRGVGRHIILVRGNHETQHWQRRAEPALLAQVFTDILDEAEVTDHGRLVRMCHYPRPELYTGEESSYLLYGHLHDQPPRQDVWKELCAKPNVLNVSAEVGAYSTGRWGRPGTLDEWVFFNIAWQDKLSREANGAGG